MNFIEVYIVSILSFKSILESSSDAYAIHFLADQLPKIHFSEENQLVVLRYILDRFTLRVSPINDYLDNPTVVDRIRKVVDTWETAWWVVINEGVYTYFGYNEKLRAVGQLMV